MKKFIDEYKELLFTPIFTAAFFLMQLFADGLTAGSSPDWLFRFPAAICVLLHVPLLTEFLWKASFPTLAKERAETGISKPIVYTYAAVFLGVAVFLASLI